MARNIFEGKITGQVKQEKIFQTEWYGDFFSTDKVSAQYAVIRAEMVQVTLGETGFKLEHHFPAW